MMLQKGTWEGQRLLGSKTVELMTVNHIRPKMFPLKIRGYERLGEGFGLGFGVNIDQALSQNLGSEGTTAGADWLAQDSSSVRSRNWS